MNRETFKNLLKERPLLLDGAMGTELHGGGIGIDQCFDSVNRSDPALVAEIHRRYIDAGADIIESNTFGANRFKLSRFGLENEVTAINREAVAIARRVIEASFKQVLLAGSIGPLGVRLMPLGRVSAREAGGIFAQQFEALLESPDDGSYSRGVDLVILETFSDLDEIEIAARTLRTISPELPLVGMITFTRDDRTLLGDTPVVAADRLAQMDLDLIGVNCSSGPVQLLRILSLIREVLPDSLLAAAPNAGWPQQLEGGRVMYPATPEYFGRYVTEFVRNGARLVGGCCGTTAAHILAMRRALDSPPGTDSHHPVELIRSEAAPFDSRIDQPSRLAQALEGGEFVVTVEMSPPRGIAAQRLLAGARTLKEAGANFIDVADNPLARMRMSAWAAAHLVQKIVGVEAILHFPTRGRNLLRIQGDLLAAYTLGIRNLFVVMGDPTQIGDFPEAMDNYDIVPSGLIRLIKERLNSGVDQAGRSIDQPTNFTVGCALNLEPADPQKELNLLRKKIKNGADFAITQPIFNPDVAKQFVADYRNELGEKAIPIIAGVQPLYNSGNSEFLHNEVPGIVIPARIRRRMKEAANPQREGVKIAQELIEELKPVVGGFYLIPVFSRYDLVADVLDLFRQVPA